MIRLVFVLGGVQDGTVIEITLESIRALFVCIDQHSTGPAWRSAGTGTRGTPLIQSAWNVKPCVSPLELDVSAVISI